MMNYSAIAKTGFYTSILSYVVFLFAEYVRPGFVSFVFSPHLILLSLLGFGIWWSIIYKDEESSRYAGFLRDAGLVGLGLVLFIIIWSEGEMFGDLRILIALISLSAPIIVYKLLSSPDDSGNIETYE